eukprot:TRINITY_DN26778_c0_g1_i2.p1 TRINITY_DN26778_c0_g1~~TRINITY_DN26778_c0_g1_i2.p1  ORF type:complete len:413 (-),score=133.71 TRINITY_DN26778_c0_g1_i2:12-1250(-)
MCIRDRSYFERKHYFYCDMPSGFQITQQRSPIATDGVLDVPLGDGKTKQVRIARVQLEQDSGKSIHDVSPELSLVDLNRAGVGLMEIVSEPDMQSAEEACNYVKTAQALLRCVGSCDGNMEDGSLRCDVNVSVELDGVKGNRCEIKNLNSIKSISKAIEFEVQRHSELLRAGQAVLQQTRRYDVVSGATAAMRSKEDSVDYRFMPEPDLPALLISDSWIDRVRASIPELPQQSFERLQEQYNLPSGAVSVLLGQPGGMRYFEDVLGGAEQIEPKQALNWVSGELVGQLHKTAAVGLDQSPVRPKQLQALLLMVNSGEISNSAGKLVLEHMLGEASPESPKDVAAKLGLQQIRDSDQLRQLCQEVITNNATEAAEYKAGKSRRMKHLVGQLMKVSKGRADPKMGSSLLKEMLS